MGFIRLRVAGNQKSGIRRFMEFKIFSYGRCFNLKHFLVDWPTFRQNKHVKLQTPLFTINIGNYSLPAAPKLSPTEIALMNHPRALFVSINSNHCKRAHSFSYTNTLRETVWRVMNELPLQQRKFNLFGILINSYSVYATQAEFEWYLRQTFQTYLKKNNSKSVSIGHKKQLFSLLFPFAYQNWNFDVWKQHFEVLYGILSQSFFPIFIAHHYRIHSSQSLQDLRADLKEFAALLNKFDFITFIYEVLGDNLKLGKTRAKRLVRILKWRTPQTQDYLIFMINQYGPESLKKGLFLFQEVYKSLPPSTNFQ